MTNPEPPLESLRYAPRSIPAVALRASWSATDGNHPETVEIEWSDAPEPGVVTETIRMLLDSGGRYEIIDASGGHTTTAPLADVDDECAATGPGHDGTGHWCKLDSGHDPVEPDGRAHRCRCGGLFATGEEQPALPGRAARERAAARRESGR